MDIALRFILILESYLANSLKSGVGYTTWIRRACTCAAAKEILRGEWRLAPSWGKHNTQLSFLQQ